MRNREILGRQFRIVLELAQHAQGLTSEKLAQRLGASRATINRDLNLLRRSVGLPIARIRRTGEVWHRLRELPLASLSPTPLQVAALRLARSALTPLHGTALVGQLDALLALLPTAPPPPRGLAVAEKRQRIMAGIVATIDHSMRAERSIEILVRVAAHGGEQRRYVLDPLLLRMVADDLYLFAWSHERRGARTFKVARIQEAMMRDEAAMAHPDLNAEEAFNGAVKAWSGSLTAVRVRLRPEVAWLVDEYPLVAGQRVVREQDGGVVVGADVAGLVEALRWVLSWGRNAEVLEPGALRRAVVDELTKALTGYTDGEVRSRKVSGANGREPFASEGHGASSLRRVEETS